MTKHGRRPKYFELRDKDKLPKKYQDTSRYTFDKLKGGHHRLYDLQEKVFVVKNAVSASRPRFQAIAGNKVLRFFDEHMRMKVMDYLKAEFQKILPSTLGINYPFKMECEIHTLPRYMNWDLDNLWVYHKSFLDGMKEKGLPKDAEGKLIYDGSGFIKDDCILNITQAPGARFIPVSSESERKLVYILTEDTDPRITGHLMYNMNPVEREFSNVIRGWLLSPTSIGKTGNISLDIDKQVIYANIGAKKMETNKEKCYERVFYQCIQMNIRELTITKDMDGKAAEKCFLQKGVKLWIIQ